MCEEGKSICHCHVIFITCLFPFNFAPPLSLQISSTSPLFCLSVIDCRDPGTPQNGRRQLPATTFATTVIYSCSVGYSIKGPDRRVCQDNGRWSNFLPVCEPINCGDPGSPVNAIRLLSATTLSSQVQFQCVEGHEMEGDAVRSCQADGQWTGTLPRCVRK